MRTNDMIQLMHHPDSLNTESLADLARLVEEYPYFQTARLLYLMNLKALKDSTFNSELKKTACYMVDRRALFFQIQNEEFESSRAKELEKPENELKVDTSFSLVDFFLSEKEKGQEENASGKHGIEETTITQASTDYLSLLLSEGKKTESPPSALLQNQDVIDRFLEEDQRSPIRIKLNDSVGTEDKATSALEGEIMPNESEFFSETLAKIYLKQKKYEKALEIIRKLYLLNPEKSIYFADQIRFLERLITNIKNNK